MLNFGVDLVSEMVAAHSNLAGSGSHEDEKVVDSLLVYFYILTETFWLNKPRMRHAHNFLLSLECALVGCINVKVKISSVQVQPTNSLKKK